MHLDHQYFFVFLLLNFLVFIVEAFILTIWSLSKNLQNSAHILVLDLTILSCRIALAIVPVVTVTCFLPLGGSNRFSYKILRQLQFE